MGAVANRKCSVQVPEILNTHRILIRTQLVIAYFQHYGAKVSKSKGSMEKGDWEPLLKQLLELVVEAPRRAQIIQYYSSTYWDARIDAQFQIDWVARGEVLRREGKEVPSKPPVDEKLKMARHCWEREEEGNKT